MKNPLTLEAFADWLDRQPADKPYEYWSNSCAIGTYLKEQGFPLVSLGTTVWIDKDDERHELPLGFNIISVNEPRTYGAAAIRARSALEQRTRESRK